MPCSWCCFCCSRWIRHPNVYDPRSTLLEGMLHEQHSHRSRGAGIDVHGKCGTSLCGKSLANDSRLRTAPVGSRGLSARVPLFTEGLRLLPTVYASAQLRAPLIHLPPTTSDRGDYMSSSRWRRLKQDWVVLSYYQRFEGAVAFVLTIVIGLIILVALYRLASSVLAGLVSKRCFMRSRSFCG